MRNFAPNEESQNSTEQREDVQGNSQENSTANTDDSGVGDVVGGMVEVALDIFGGIFED